MIMAWRPDQGCKGDGEDVQPLPSKWAYCRCGLVFACCWSGFVGYTCSSHFINPFYPFINFSVSLSVLTSSQSKPSTVNFLSGVSLPLPKEISLRRVVLQVVKSNSGAFMFIWHWLEPLRVFKLPISPCERIVLRQLIIRCGYGVIFKLALFCDSPS